MAIRTHRNQTFFNGEIIAEEVVEVITYPSPDESLIAAARLVVLPKIAADELKDAAAEVFAGLFPDWEPGIAVKVGEVYRWDGTLVQVIQAHTTQADWAPDKVPALFKIHRTATDTPQPWVQPQGAHDAYQVGDRATHNGQTWESTAANNVWEPGVFGWTAL
jgi:hypothetical protein